MKDGIAGYDQNRDGVLDLATELDWSWVPLISDFTPGEDKFILQRMDGLVRMFQLYKIKSNNRTRYWRFSESHSDSS